MVMSHFAHSRTLKILICDFTNFIRTFKVIIVAALVLGKFDLEAIFTYFFFTILTKF